MHSHLVRSSFRDVADAPDSSDLRALSRVAGLDERSERPKLPLTTFSLLELAFTKPVRHCSAAPSLLLSRGWTVLLRRRSTVLPSAKTASVAV